MSIRLLPFEHTLAGKKVLVTGHTGFTGSWATLWLQRAGAQIAGYALAPETRPALYHEAGLEQGILSETGDVNDYAHLSSFMAQVQPDLILHLAAQPLVRKSYREPVSTFATNVMGTAHVLEAARHTPSVRGVVCITTDKVYRNNEWPWAYRENDPLGGSDPYSASKAAAEMVIDSYRASYGDTDGKGLAIATARGGNIIGGGDWSEDRLIPDFVRAVVNDGILTLRYPDATRPWQHVLGLVQGYLMLLAGLLEHPQKYARAWNLGPQDNRQLSVSTVLDIMSQAWTRPALDMQNRPLHEAHALALDSSLARNLLGWWTPWSTEQAIHETAAWYRHYYKDPATARVVTQAQLDAWRGALLDQAHL
ncbi:MAG TPA: CDP-glucose 4,6-dehydratase [Burkholderiaceae bacterium]